MYEIYQDVWYRQKYGLMEYTIREVLGDGLLFATFIAASYINTLLIIYEHLKYVKNTHQLAFYVASC